MTIFSRLHVFEEYMQRGQGAPSESERFVAKARSCPVFVLQGDAVELLERSDCKSSVEALKEAGMLRLPHPQMIVEMSLHPKLHEIVYLEEKDDRIYAQYAFLELENKVGGIVKAVLSVTLDPEGFRMEFNESLMPKLLQQGCVDTIHLALVACYVLLNMKGIEREIHNSDPLNKHRARKGKPQIVNYTYLRIGHVYRSDGTKMKHVEGRHLPMHVRAAHTRQQPCGEGNKDRKLIFIPSCIVNFDPGATIQHKQKVVKA